MCLCEDSWVEACMPFSCGEIHTVKRKPEMLGVQRVVCVWGGAKGVAN